MCFPGIISYCSIISERKELSSKGKDRQCQIHVVDAWHINNLSHKECPILPEVMQFQNTNETFMSSARKNE